MKILSALLNNLLTESANNNKKFISGYIIKYLNKKKKIRNFLTALDELKEADKQQHAVEAYWIWTMITFSN